MKGKIKILFLIPFVLLACRGELPLKEEAKYPTIYELKKNASLYEGKVVEITGKFLGWSAKECTPPHITRSDWAIGDDSGEIYVTGGWPGRLDPVDGMGTPLLLKGILRLKDGKIPYLELLDVRILERKGGMQE
jgi:hypothetical protein